jgi:triphosphoribosyl-dephospho-CoA synthase
MTCRPTSPAERAALAMMLEVAAGPKPGNVDRCHDYPDTRLEHFLASVLFSLPALARAERGEGGIGDLIYDAVESASCHSGGNTHFGAFLLLVPLIFGKDIEGAKEAVSHTTVEDAVRFYEAFALTQVRMLPSDELDVNDPGTLEEIRRRGMTLHDIMAHSAGRDMVAAEWVEGFPLTREAADYLHIQGPGPDAIPHTFLLLLASHLDTFIVKKHGMEVAREVRKKAAEAHIGIRDVKELDKELLDRGINPGSIADITIAGIYTALAEGWRWE